MECHHVQSVADGGEAEHFRGMGVMVSLSDAASDRMALRPLLDTLAFARCTAIGGTEWPERLAKRVAALRPHFATAVIHIRGNAGLVAETVQTEIDTLRRLLGSELALVVVVSAKPELLAALNGANGFVCGVLATNGDTARQVFLALASLLAPESFGGIDILDLLPALGSANAPTLLAEALWFREGDGRVMFQSQADMHAVASAASIVVVPFVCNSSWDEQRRLRQAIGAEVGESTTTNFFATNNALLPGLLPSGVGWVPILCTIPSDSFSRKQGSTS